MARASPAVPPLEARSYQRRPRTSVGSPSSSTGNASTGRLSSMWCAVLRNVRPENNATAAMAMRTTTPAPVRGNVWLGARVDPGAAGAATSEPLALRVGGVVALLVVGVVT